MVQLEYQQTKFWWWYRIWKLQAPLKAILILWLAMNNKLLTWEALLKCGFMAPGICLLCRVEREMCTHHFFNVIMQEQYGKKSATSWILLPIEMRTRLLRTDYSVGWKMKGCGFMKHYQLFFCSLYGKRET